MRAILENTKFVLKVENNDKRYEPIVFHKTYKLEIENSGRIDNVEVGNEDVLESMRKVLPKMVENNIKVLKITETISKFNSANKVSPQTLLENKDLNYKNDNTYTDYGSVVYKNLTLDELLA
jgi:hypothetical protein